jgi:hypothetical protein
VAELMHAGKQYLSKAVPVMAEKALTVVIKQDLLYVHRFN